MFRNKSKRKFNNRRPRRRNIMTRSIIPPISSQPYYRQIFRFRANSALVSTIYTRCFFNLLYVATTAVTGSPIISAFKILRTTGFAVAEGGSGTELNVIAISYEGGAYGRNDERASVGTSASPGITTKRPPRDSSASFWHSVPLTGGISANGEPIMFINSLTTGCIVDIELLFVLTDGSNLPPNSVLTCAGATATYLYSNYLDNSSCQVV
jgi:hypothetical protein